MDNRYSYYNAHMNTVYNTGSDRFRSDVEDSFQAALNRSHELEMEYRREALKAAKDVLVVLAKRALSWLQIGRRAGYGH